LFTFDRASGIPKRIFWWGGDKVGNLPTLKIDPGQFVFVILLEPFHHVATTRPISKYWNIFAPIFSIL